MGTMVPPVGGGEQAPQRTHTHTGRAGCLPFSCSRVRGTGFNCYMILQFLTLLELNFPFEGGGGRQCLGSKGTICNKEV